MSGATLEEYTESHEAAWRTIGEVAAQGAGIVGSSPKLLAALSTAQRFAKSKLPILLLGDTGTGKELLARYVHLLSGREGPLVDVNCAAIPDDLVEGVLFGHRRGAFTGAHDHAEGLIELADHGTLFLDELASLSPVAQGKLLRVLETGEVRRLGATATKHVDFRLVATMQGEPGVRLTPGAFRADLLQRIAGVTIRIPSLAERPEDVVPISRFFASRASTVLTSDAEAILAMRDWPGNIRELRWVVERAALLASRGAIHGSTIREALEIGLGVAGPLPSVDDGSRVTELRAVCAAHRGDPLKVAQSLHVSKATLYRWLRAAGLNLRSFKPSPGTSANFELAEN